MNLILVAFVIMALTLVWSSWAIHRRSNKGEGQWLIPLVVVGIVTVMTVAQVYYN